MRPAFIIMQIGNEDLDRVAASAIVPALSSSGFDAKRVDKHNQGELLKSEIIHFIQSSDIIVADLTNERPNCYLEVGYAMGANKFKNLILTVREDHFLDSPNHKSNGPKVHFDLAGYDILTWKQDELDAFRQELEKRIRRRLEIIDAAPRTDIQDRRRGKSLWLLQQREAADEGIRKTRFSAYMEATFMPASEVEHFALPKLKSAADAAQISTFGWPIAPYIHRDEFQPRPTTHGIVAEVAPKLEEDEARDSYDYWAIRTNGEFYWRGSLFEDNRRPGEIFFDTRIVRVTEALLYCKKLYLELGFNAGHVITIHVRHAGLKDRILTAASSTGRLRPLAPSLEDQSEVVLSVRLEQIESELTQLVKKILDPLFSLFDFFELSDSVYQHIVTNFQIGKV